MSPLICPKCQTPQAWEMWRHCHCGYDFGPPAMQWAAEDHSEKTRRELFDREKLTVADWPSPGEAVRSIRLRLVCTWLIVGTLLWIGWSVHEVLRIHVYNMGMGAVALILPRLCSKVPRFAGFAASVRVRVWVATIAAVLLVGCFLLPAEAQPYVLAALFVPGAVAAIYSEARVFYSPLLYLSPASK